MAGLSAMTSALKAPSFAFDSQLAAYLVVYFLGKLVDINIDVRLHFLGGFRVSNCRLMF